MKKILIVFIFLFFIQPVFANRSQSSGSGTNGGGVKPTIEKIKEEIKEEIKPTVNAIREETREQIKEQVKEKLGTVTSQLNNEIKEKRNTLLEQIRNTIRERVRNLRYQARITGVITAIGEKSLTVKDKSDQVYTVSITDKTQLRRHFWGKAEWTDFSVGNEVTVIGRFTNEEKTTIEAILIKNDSVQRRWGVFFGEVVEKNTDNFVIETVNRGKIKVSITKASFVDRSGQTINFYQLVVGHRVRVKGVWDKTLSEIIETDEVKDFSLPPLPTKIEKTNTTN